MANPLQAEVAKPTPGEGDSRVLEVISATPIFSLGVAEPLPMPLGIVRPPQTGHEPPPPQYIYIYL
jgi:hypothetical protein